MKSTEKMGKRFEQALYKNGNPNDQIILKVTRIEEMHTEKPLPDLPTWKRLTSDHSNFVTRPLFFFCPQ